MVDGNEFSVRQSRLDLCVRDRSKVIWVNADIHTFRIWIIEQISVRMPVTVEAASMHALPGNVRVMVTDNLLN